MQLAKRMVAARTISRFFRKLLDQKTEATEKKKREKTHALDRLAKNQKELLESILAHSRVSNLSPLIALTQIDPVSFIKKLQQVYAKINYLQELMIVKVFNNSIEISKAIIFMNELRSMHKSFCERACLFANDQADILNEFDLMGKGDDALRPLYEELCSEYSKLNTKIRLWEIHVFQGDSSGFALKRIIEEQSYAQSRLKLKWQKMKPSNRRQRFAAFKEKMVKKIEKQA